MGEIGISRHEFYHELRWWEVRAIISGYNKRHHHGWEQARLIAYNARFCMGSRDPLPRIDEWLKFPWEKSHEVNISDEEADDILAEIDALNGKTSE